MRIVDISKILKDHSNLKHKFQDLLPELIHKLVKDTSSTITFNRFPSRDATSTPGFDGMVKNKTACEFVPIGDSFWEIGTSGLKKINDDYNKRTTNFPNDIKEKTTFILVFPKYWTFDISSGISMAEWQNERKSEWKDVFIYDAEILNNWLEEHINIALWFLNELGITQNILNCNLVQPAFDILIDCTKPKLNSEIFYDEREESKTDLINQLSSNNTIYVKSESRFESYGFILSSILNSKNENLIDQCIVINDRQSFEYINHNLNEKKLVLNFEETNELRVENNQLIIPCYKNNLNGNGIDLKIRGQRTMAKLLSNLGLDSQESTNINFKSNGNLLIIRRLIAKDLIAKQPRWATMQDVTCIIPLMLLKTFDNKNQSHIKIAEYITGLNKEIFLQKLLVSTDIEDCPFRIIDNVYQLYNLEECWFVLKKFITDEMFEKVGNILNFIYCNKQSSENCALVSDGLTNSHLDAILKIIAFYALDSDKNQKSVNLLVLSLLDSEKSNKYLISKNLKMLAECSPKAICEFLEYNINNKSQYLINLLNSNDYCYLLSAINYLLCLNKYKFRAITLLLNLSNYNIKYLYSNNPKSDLKEALIPYFNKNALSIQEKLEILKAKIEIDCKFVELYINIISSNTCCTPITFNVRKPAISDMPTYGELNQYREQLDSLVFQQIFSNNDINQIQKIIKDYYIFTPEHIKSISDYFANNKMKFNNESLYEIYSLTIEKLATIRKFQNHENWIGKKVYIEPFMSLIDNIKPNDIFLQYKYMFENYSDYIDMEDNDGTLSFNDLEIKRNLIRIDTLKMLETNIGKKKTITYYINNVSDDGIWGDLLVKVFNDNVSLDMIFNCCIKAEKYYILSGVMDKASDKEKAVEIFNQNINKDLKIKILPLLQAEEYEKLCSFDAELKAFYSKKSIGIHNDCSEKKYEKFLKYNPVGLLDYFYNKVFDDKLYAQCIDLLNVLKNNMEQIKQRHYYWELSEIFKSLESYQYSEELALLELEYLEFFEQPYPKALVSYWFYNPNKFIDYCKITNDDKVKYSIIFKLQYHLCLQKVHYDDEHNFLAFCDALIKQDDKLLTATLGCILGKSCIDDDGIFPHKSVRLILERNNDCLNRHFTMGYINSIGVRFVGSGKSEFEKSYALDKNARILAIKYPITSNLLFELSEFHKNTGNEDKSYDLLGI